MTQIGVFRTSHNSGLECPNPKISKPIIKPLPLAFRQKKNWANSTFLWAANRVSAKVVEKSVKSEAKCHETGQNFKTSYLGLGMNFLDIFRAQNDRLVVGYLMGKEIFEFRPNLCPWQLFKEGNCQGILANFATSAKTLRLRTLKG